MTTPKPEWATSKYGVTYEEIVDSWGWEVEAFETFGSYQGDHLALLRDGESVGLVVFGYGSCSGCDELYASEPLDEDGDWSEVVALRDSLEDEIVWHPSPRALLDWIDANPQNHWWSYDEEVQQWIDNYRREVEAAR